MSKKVNGTKRKVSKDEEKEHPKLSLNKKAFSTKPATMRAGTKPSKPSGKGSRPGSATNTPTGHGKRSSGTFFPADGASIKMMEKKIADYELEMKNLTRDNQVLASKLAKLQKDMSQKTKSISNEQKMRLQANQERSWLKQKLSRMQLAIEARLKMLGVDFSNCNDLAEALDAAFAAIQKLAAELAKKEEVINELKSEKDGLFADQENMQSAMDKLNNKIKKQQRVIDEQAKQIGDRDRRLSLMGKEHKSGKEKETGLADEIADLQAMVDKLRAEKEKQFDDFVDKKADLDAEMRKHKNDIKKLREQLEEEAKERERYRENQEKLQDENERTRAMLDKAENELAEARDRMKDMELELEQERERLQDELEQERNKGEDLKQRLGDMEEKMKKLLAQLQSKADELSDMKHALAEERGKVSQLEKDMEDTKEDLTAMQAQKKSMMELMKKLKAGSNNKGDEIEELKAKLAEALKKISDLESLNNALREDKEALRKDLEDKDSDLKERSRRGEEVDEERRRLRDDMDDYERKLREAEDRVKDFLNKPKDDKQTQTDMDAKWFQKNELKLGNIDNILRENEELRTLAHKNDVRLEELAQENQGLLDEIDMLLKQQAQFRPDTSNHRGEMLAMRASPTKLLVATSAADNTVKLWRCLPDEEKASKQVETFACARMDGRALSLAFTQDGAYLVAGCAYKNGPDGLLMIWDMTKGDGEVAFLFRSRPSIRFGRATCVCFSSSGQYIFCGDTTGRIWAWCTQRMILLAEIQAHKDVVHDVAISQDNMLFSCAYDQTIVKFDATLLEKVKVKKSRIHIHEPKRLNGEVLDRNDKYPYWSIQVSPDSRWVVAGSRKINIWSWDHQSLGKGPRLTDPDLDHVKQIHMFRGKLLVCRQKTPRAKLFDLYTGTEEKQVKFKQDIVAVQLCHTMEHAVLCTQQLQNKIAKPCKMILWKIK